MSAFLYAATFLLAVYSSLYPLIRLPQDIIDPFYLIYLAALVQSGIIKSDFILRAVLLILGFLLVPLAITFFSDISLLSILKDARALFYIALFSLIFIFLTYSEPKPGSLSLLFNTFLLMSASYAILSFVFRYILFHVSQKTYYDPGFAIYLSLFGPVLLNSRICSSTSSPVFQILTGLLLLSVPLNLYNSFFCGYRSVFLYSILALMLSLVSMLKKPLILLSTIVLPFLIPIVISLYSMAICPYEDFFSSLPGNLYHQIWYKTCISTAESGDTRSKTSLKAFSLDAPLLPSGIGYVTDAYVKGGGTYERDSSLYYFRSFMGVVPFFLILVVFSWHIITTAMDMFTTSLHTQRLFLELSLSLLCFLVIYVHGSPMHNGSQALAFAMLLFPQFTRLTRLIKQKSALKF